MSDNLNEKIVKHLEHLALVARNETKFRMEKIYKNAIEIVENLIDQIENDKQLSEVRHEFGLSKTAEKAISEFLKKNSHSTEKIIKQTDVDNGDHGRMEHNLVKPNNPNNINNAPRIEHYHQQMMLKRSEVEKLRGDYDITTLSQLKGYDVPIVQFVKHSYQIKCIQNYEDLIQPIEKNEAKQYLLTIKKILKVVPDLKIVLCGDFRRQKSSSFFVDFLIVIRALSSYEQDFAKKLKTETQNIINLIKNDGIFVQNLMRKNDEYSGLFRLSNNHPFLRVLLYFASQDQYVCRKFFHTGPDEFFKNIQVVAAKKGFRLTKNCLYKQ